MLNEANQKVLKAPLNAFELATDAAITSKKSGDKKVEASAYNTLGTLYFNAGKYLKAIEFFTKAKTIYLEIEDDKNEEYTLKYLGKSYQALDDKEKSINYYKQAEEKSNSSREKGNYRIVNSKIKKSQGKEKEAIGDLERELVQNKELDRAQKIDIYLELGELYFSQQDTTKAVSLIDKALATSKTRKNDSLDINTLNSVWNIYDQNGMQSQNIETQRTFLDSSVVNLNLEKTVNYNIGNSLLNNDAKEAATFFKLSADLAQSSNDQVERVKAIEKLSESYEKSGEYDKALEQYKLYVQLVDSIKLIEVASQLQNEMLLTKYEVQESRIKELEEKQKEKEEALSRQRWMIALLILGIFALIVLTYFLVKNIREKQKSNMKIRLASLRAQMNPHFIFNSLNSVNGFISQNEEIKANKYLSDFSKLMRTVLNNTNNEKITLEEELKSLEIYLSLEQSRFSDKFDFVLDIDSDISTQNIQIPPMLIQPYLENAVWHGLRYREEKGLLTLAIQMEGNSLKVSVSDNGIGRKQSLALKTKHQKDYKSTGMSNTQERLTILNKLYDKSYTVKVIDLQTADDTGTIVELRMPIDV